MVYYEMSRESRRWNRHHLDIAVSHDRILASVRQADGPANFNPFEADKKICSSTTKKSASVRQP